MLDLILCVRNRIYREGLERLLGDRAEFGNVRACCGVGKLAELVAAGEGQAILVDLTAGPQEDSVDIIGAAFHAANGRPVIALGLDGSDEEVLAWVEAGAAACVTCEDSVEDLVSVILAAANGELVCPPRIGRLLQERLVGLRQTQRGAERLGRLSQRELHVLSLLEDSLSNKQIARSLGLEVSTIKNHVHNIIVKLAVSSRVEAAEVRRSAARRGIAA